MAEQANDQYAALERLYSERRWAEVEASAAVLLAELDGELRSRVLLLLGHTRLYGYKDAGVAAEHYRQVLAAEPEALLVDIAQEGLNQCLAAQVPSPADAMPWLEKIAGPEVAGQEPLQSVPGVASPVEPFESLDKSESPTEIAEGIDQLTQPTKPIQPTQLSPKESAELAKGLLGVVIRPN